MFFYSSLNTRLDVKGLVMNIKAYLLASLLVPMLVLIFILIGLAIDIASGNMNISEEISDGGLAFLLLGYLLFVLISLITTFIIIFFVPIFLKLVNSYNKRVFFLMGALIGALASLITLTLMADGNLTRDNGLYSIWFAIMGTIIGFLSAYIYNKFAYALDICD